MICYCVFDSKADAGLVELQDESGRSLGDVSGIELTPHPNEAGRWRLGPFYVPRGSTSEFSAGDLR